MVARLGVIASTSGATQLMPATFELQAKAAGWSFVAPEVLAMTPYLATIVVLTMMSLGRRTGGRDAPACLGKPFPAQ